MPAMPHQRIDPYVYREYPKHVVVGGRTIQVHDEEEEAQARGTGDLKIEAEEHTRLLKVAEVKGLKVDGRWRNDRIADLIRNAGFDPELDPFK